MRLTRSDGFSVALALALVGCASSSHYEWGRYEESIYNTTLTPDGFDAQAEIDTLEAQLEETQADDRLPPPGLHAHVGWLQAASGNLDAARTHFEEEKRLFPESTRFMDELIERSSKGS